MIRTATAADHDRIVDRYRDVAAVHLAQVGDRAPGGEVVEHELEVALRDGALAVLEEREVERVVGRTTDPAVPVGEGQLDGAEGGAVVVQRSGSYLRKSGMSRSSSSKTTCGAGRGVGAVWGAGAW